MCLTVPLYVAMQAFYFQSGALYSWSIRKCTFQVCLNVYETVNNLIFYIKIIPFVTLIELSKLILSHIKNASHSVFLYKCTTLRGTNRQFLKINFYWTLLKIMVISTLVLKYVGDYTVKFLLK
jgi:hypothetical protein